MAVLAGTDFFTVEVWTPKGLVTYYVLFVIHLSTRKVSIEGVTSNPNSPFMLQIARNLTDEVLDNEDCLLDGEPPSPIDLPPGCSFAARCPNAMERCRGREPDLSETKPGRFSACFLNQPTNEEAA